MRRPLKYEPARVPILKHKFKHCNVIKKKQKNPPQFKVLRIFILFFIISYINYNAVFPEIKQNKVIK